MPSRRTFVTLAATSAVAASAVAVALPVTQGAAQAPSRTMTLTFAKPEKRHFQDVAPCTLKQGEFSIGDRFVHNQAARVDGKPGTFHSISTVTNRRPAPWSKFTAVESVVVDLADGQVFATVFVDAADGGAQAAIIGGTGVYAGATGSVTPTESGATVMID